MIREGDYKMHIEDFIAKAYSNANQKGFWEDLDCSLKEVSTQDELNAIGNRLMLIVGEVAEAQEALRKNDKENFKEELADVAIRLFDLCGGLDVDLGAEIVKKMEKNRTRPYKHGKAF
jgi:NTP pyrophosphatase (non-canonical NTP hydrolase)